MNLDTMTYLPSSHRNELARARGDGRRVSLVDGGSRCDEDERIRVVKAQHEDSDDFDLRANYQNAVDCLIHCEVVMKKLQEELASKNCQIANLEGKLVEMSLELASSKATVDEQSQQLRRLKRKVKENKARQGSSEDLAPFVAYSPISCARSGSNPKVDRDMRSKFSRSLSSVDYPQTEVMPWPARDDEGSCSEEDTARPVLVVEQRSLQHPEPPKRRGGFRLSSFTWGAAGESGEGLDESSKSLNDSAKESVFSLNSLSSNNNSSNCYTAPAIPSSGSKLALSSATAPKRQNRHRRQCSWNLSSSNNSNCNTAPAIPSSSSKLALSPVPAPKRQNRHRRQCSWQGGGGLDDSGSRRFSNLGNFLLNLGKNDGEGAATAATPGSRGNRPHEVVLDKTNPSHPIHRPLPSLEGVIFPSTSQDCLTGLLESSGADLNLLAKSSDRRSSTGSVIRRTVSNGDRANAEWSVLG